MHEISNRRAVLVGWDAADWDLLNPLLDCGQLPHLQALVEHGVMGTTRTRGPLIGPLVYSSVATGKHADKHGILGPLEVRGDGSIGPTTSQSRTAKAFWEILSDHGCRLHVVNFPATSPAEAIRGVLVAPEFFAAALPGRHDAISFPPGSVCPEAQGDVLREWIVSLEEIDAETMATFVPRFRELDATDPRLLEIGAAVAHALSVHAVATWLMEQTPWDVISVNYPLVDFLGARFLRYHSAEQADADGTEPNLFRNVMPGAMKLCDMLLGRLIELADPDAEIMLYSPCGLLRREGPDQGELEWRESPRYGSEGICVLRAAGLPADELIQEVSCTDICPTLLRLRGLPVGSDMDGRAVQDLFEKNRAAVAPPVSWEDVGTRRGTGAAARHRKFPRRTFGDRFEDNARRRIEEENLWTLARAQLAAGRREEAVPLMLRLYHANPLDVERGPLVAESLYLAGYAEAARDVMIPLAEAFADTAVGQFMGGFLALMRCDYPRALDLFRKALAAETPFPRLSYYLGYAYLVMDQREEAAAAFRRALELDPGFQLSYLGLSEALLRLQRLEEAGEAALSAVGCGFAQPAGHIALGRVLSRLGDLPRAREAYATALKLDPENSVARAHLDLLERTARGQPEGLPGGAALGLTPPLYPRLESRPGSPATIQGTLADIRAWRNAYMDDLEAAESRLDEYLEKNAALIQGNPDSTASRIFGGDKETLEKLRAEHWSLRPVEPADVPAIRDLISGSLAEPAGTEMVVAHRLGSAAIVGGVMLRLLRRSGPVVRLRVSLRFDPAQADNKRARAAVTSFLLRAGVARAASGGAREIRCVVRQGTQESLTRPCLRELGFEVVDVRDVLTTSITELRDLCQGIEDHYRRRNKIPGDVRFTSARHIPFSRLDTFLKQWFVDGLEDLRRDYDPTLCPVILKGNEIIACAIACPINKDMSRIPYTCVQMEYRRGWATPSLFGQGTRIGAERGYSVIEFETTERFSEFKRIVQRHLNTQSQGQMITLALDLRHRWPAG